MPPALLGLEEGRAAAGGLWHRVPSPSPHLHVCTAGNFPIFFISTQPNFLHSDLCPHPGWGAHGSCQMSLWCPAPHRGLETSPSVQGDGSADWDVGRGGKGPAAAPSTHTLLTGCTTSRKPPPPVPQPPPPACPTGGAVSPSPQPCPGIREGGAQAVPPAHPAASPREWHFTP